jgi:DnaJ-class molecular chaperone
MSMQIPNPAPRRWPYQVTKAPCQACCGSGRVPVLLVFSKVCPVCEGDGKRWILVVDTPDEL